MKTYQELYAYKCFANTTKGFILLVQWVLKLTEPAVSIHYVMEATGVYHESLACYLAAHGYSVSIILPNKISNYFRTLWIKTITDKSASEAITLFGLERKLEDWKRPKPVFKYLKSMKNREEFFAMSLFPQFRFMILHVETSRFVV